MHLSLFYLQSEYNRAPVLTDSVATVARKIIWKLKK
jgi:hypothetical protein